jgi:hypothetical protein
LECDTENGFVGVADGVELLVALFDAEENLDGVALGWRRNLHGLKTALQRTVLLNGLSKLGRSGRADALNLAARQRRL